MSAWHTDFHSPHRGLSFEITQVLHKAVSPYQEIHIVDTPEFGRMMLLDGVLMLTASDEFTYHEMLVHPAMITHPHPRNVLIIGGGDCGSLTRVLQHPCVEKVVQVEIDEMVYLVARQFFPQLTQAADDPRVELLFMDGIEYLKSMEAAFDVILIDSTDPIGPAKALFADGNPAGIKAALEIKGLISNNLRLPLMKVEKPLYNQLSALIQELDAAK